MKKNKEKLIREYQRAKGIEEEKDKLLETLPRRKVSFRHHEVLADGYGIHKVEFKLHKLALDRKSLYSLNWKFGKKSSWLQKGVTIDQLNKLEKGGFYGWPFYNGDNIEDPDFGEFGSKPANAPIMPVHKFKAHNAPLGLTFLKNQSNQNVDDFSILKID